MRRIFAFYGGSDPISTIFPGFGIAETLQGTLARRRRPGQWTATPGLRSTPSFPGKLADCLPQSQTVHAQARSLFLAGNIAIAIPVIDINCVLLILIVSVEQDLKPPCQKTRHRED